MLLLLSQTYTTRWSHDSRQKKQLSPQWTVLQRMFMKCLPSETTGRICLVVSCWMAACVCFWKTSLASHLQGSSTTSTFTSLPGESKFHISVTDCVEGKEAPWLPPAMLHFPTKLLFNNKQKWNEEKNSLNHSIIHLPLPICHNNKAIAAETQFYNITR